MNDRPTLELTTNRGHRLQAFNGDSITNEIRENGVYDQWTLLAIEYLLKKMKADICLDVGANIGNHAVVIAQHCRQLHAFEPIPFIFELLRSNLLRNADNCNAYCLALSDKSSVASIHVDSGGNLGKSTMLSDTMRSDAMRSDAMLSDSGLSDSGLSDSGLSDSGLSDSGLSDTVSPNRGQVTNSGTDQRSNTIEISAMRGDDQVSNLDGSIDFIKIDVEGFEPRVISGLRRTIETHQPVLLLEWNSTEARNGFESAGLFTAPLGGYQHYSLTHRRSKQVSGGGFKGAMSRAMIKISNSDDWCVRPFNAESSYPNVLMFPPRWQALAAGLPVS